MPLTFLDRGISVDDLTVAMLATVDPFALEATTVLHEHDARSVLLVVLVLALVTAAIWVTELTMAVHLVGQPGSFVHTTIAPCVTAIALDIVVGEVAEVVGAVAPGELALALLASFDVITFVASSIAPSLDTLAVLLVVLPLALINRTVEVQVFSLAVCFIVAPLTDIDIAIRMDQPAETMGLALEPLALVEGAVEPDKSAYAHTCLQVDGPLACIDHAILHAVRFLVNEFLIGHERWRVESTLTLVDLLYASVEKESFNGDARVKGAGHLFPLLHQLSNLPHSLPDKLSAHNRLDVNDASEDDGCAAIHFLSQFA